MACTCNLRTGFPAYSHTQVHDPVHIDTGTAGWRGPSRQIVPGEMMDHLGSGGVLFPSAAQGSPSQMIEPAFSPSGELYSPSMVQDFPPYATSFPPGQVQDAQSHVVTHGPNTTTRASQLRQQKAQEKKEKDKLNKRDHRSRNAEDFKSICALLKIPLKPKNWLAHRSKCLYIQPRLEYLAFHSSWGRTEAGGAARGGQ